MIPIPLRNALYAAFVEALAQPDPEPVFTRIVRDAGFPAGTERAYISDRVPRFIDVLRQYQREARAGMRPLERDLLIGRLLFNHGFYFDCHEFLESAWRRSTGSEKTMLQGLIQAGAGFHKLELGSPEGAAELLGKAAEKLSVAEKSGVAGKLTKAEAPRNCSLAAFAKELRRTAAALKDGTFDWRDAPRMMV